MQRSSLCFHTDIRTANAAITQQPSCYEFRRVDADGKAQSLCAHDGCRVHADDASVRGH